MKTNSGRLSRRTVLAGMAGLAAARPAFADDAPSPVAHGILANNALALAFEAAPAQLPDVRVLGPDSERNISELMGRTLIMPLWAEWCAPCMGEIPDFARLQQKYGSPKFAIVPILTGPQKKVSPSIIAELFGLVHASVFEPLMENHWGGALLAAMARNKSGTVNIPCNLLIAPDGHVVGREFGLKYSDAASASINATPSANMRSTILSHAQAGDSLSLWGQPEGEELAQALANGFLG